jgi:ferritin-like protein
MGRLFVAFIGLWLARSGFMITAGDQPRGGRMSSEGLHEEISDLSETTRDVHRAISSLREELEAVDWYQQRADACKDDALREILLHNMREEIEHSAMVLEWLRRNHTDFDAQLKGYLFSEASITHTEEKITGDGGVTTAADPTKRATIGALRNKK